MSVIRDGRSLVAVVLESDEGTGMCAVRDRQPAFAHRAMIPKWGRNSGSHPHVSGR